MSNKDSNGSAPLTHGVRTPPSKETQGRDVSDINSKGSRGAIHEARTPAREETGGREAARAKKNFENMMSGRPGQYQCNICYKKMARNEETHGNSHPNILQLLNLQQEVQHIQRAKDAQIRKAPYSSAGPGATKKYRDKPCVLQDPGAVAKKIVNSVASCYA